MSSSAGVVVQLLRGTLNRVRSRRCRSLTRWLLTCAVVGVVGLFTLSVWRTSVIMSGPFGDSVGIKSGCAFRIWTTSELRERNSARSGFPTSASMQWAFHTGPRRTDMEWLPQLLSWSASGRRSVTIPLWAPLIVLGVPAAWLWWHHTRHRHGAGCCGRCGYDLSGLQHATCPECGTPCGRPLL